MLLAKHLEFAQQIIIICSKGSIKSITFFKLFLNCSLVLMYQVKKLFIGRRVGVIITYIVFHTFGHKTNVGWWSHAHVDAGGESLGRLIAWVCAWFFTTTYPFAKNDEGFFLGLLLRLLLESPLNLHKLVVRLIFEEDHVSIKLIFFKLSFMIFACL